MFVNNHRTIYKETVRNARGTYKGRFLQDVWNLGWYMHTCIHICLTVRPLHRS